MPNELNPNDNAYLAGLPVEVWLPVGGVVGGARRLKGQHQIKTGSYESLKKKD